MFPEKQLQSSPVHEICNVLMQYGSQAVWNYFENGEQIGRAVLNCSDSSDDESTEAQDDSLGEAARTEREYVRQRLSEELGREPTEDEVDEWLRQHTEGY